MFADITLFEAAIRRASSFVSSLAADRWPGPSENGLAHGINLLA
jgi:hypothetical protein